MSTPTGTARLLDDATKRRLVKFGNQLRGNTKASIGAGIIAVLVALAILAPLFIPEGAADATNPANRLQAPSAEHVFGTDHLGRDIFYRLILGTRISLYVGILSVGIATIFGVSLGAIAGYVGDNLDDAIMRPMDVIMSFPPVLFALAITAILGPTLTNTIIAIGVVYIPYFARVTRSEVVSVAQEEFVAASKAIGERDRYILFAEVLPNAAAPIIVQASISMAYAILAAAALGFLGLGAQPPTPEWGLMINEAKQYITGAPWVAIFPGLAIAVTVLGFNLLGDGIRDVLDPTINTQVKSQDE
ncbi:MAG: ABC transporter permease [Halobacteriota archaeon]